MTGWAQVSGLRGRTSISDRLEWDNYYVENWSPWLDLKTFLMTLPCLLHGNGEARPHRDSRPHSDPRLHRD
jgi:lipopolysaccharide/colanic/teichoic acid biosynthesis glycosyltransferase